MFIIACGVWDVLRWALSDQWFLHTKFEAGCIFGDDQRKDSMADDIWENGLFTSVRGLFSLCLYSGLAYLRVGAGRGCPFLILERLSEDGPRSKSS